jgi:protein SCO1/2
MAHTENVVLLDPEMRIRGVYNGTLPTDIARLMEDATLLLGL